MDKDFIIDQVRWHTQVVGNTESTEHIYARFRSIIYFLQNNYLTTRIILKPEEAITDELCFKVSDLTEKGYLLVKKCYPKWLTAIDHGRSVDNLKIFEKELNIK